MKDGNCSPEKRFWKRSLSSLSMHEALALKRAVV
jgi:hypothetical protein